MIHADRIALLRQLCFGATAVACLLYAKLALWLDVPDPMIWWIPGALGAMSAAVMLLAGALAGDAQARMAYDALYASIQMCAGNFAFWAGIALAIAASVGAAQDLFLPEVGLATVGTGMAGVYLGLIAVMERRAGG
ncbi:MAG: hypothetical protein AAFY38_16270 [Pseudomonadota bacterium]